MSFLLYRLNNSTLDAYNNNFTLFNCNIHLYA